MLVDKTSTISGLLINKLKISGEYGKTYKNFTSNSN